MTNSTPVGERSRTRGLWVDMFVSENILDRKISAP